MARPGAVDRGRPEIAGASELFLAVLHLAQLVDLLELRPAGREREQYRLADDLAEAARQEQIALVRKVVEVLAVFVFRIAQYIARRERAGERRPGNADTTEDEAHVWLVLGPHDGRQQV